MMVKAVEKADKREVGNNFFVATQGVQAKSARPEPSSDSDSDSDLSDSDLSDPEIIADNSRGCYKDLKIENKSEFESEIETELKGCFIGARQVSSGGKAEKKTVGLKRKKPQPALGHQPILERMQKEVGSLPKCKRIRSHT